MTPIIRKKALVLFSGGQDSTTCLAWALDQFEHVETIGFDYGQRHSIELDARLKVLTQFRQQFGHWAKKLGEDHVLDLPVLGQISDTALTQEKALALQADGLPNSFVPARNLLFLTLAAALGYRRGIHSLIAGMCETDYSGYPDCRNDTMQAQQQALSLGIGLPYEIQTPLMYIDKAATWAMAEQLGGKALLNIIIQDTHTCYLGIREQLHDWGYGCGTCPACELRKNGFERWSKA